MRSRQISHTRGGQVQDPNQFSLSQGFGVCVRDWVYVSGQRSCGQEVANRWCPFELIRVLNLTCHHAKSAEFSHNRRSGSRSKSVQPVSRLWGMCKRWGLEPRKCCGLGFEYQQNGFMDTKACARLGVICLSFF